LAELPAVIHCKTGREPRREISGAKAEIWVVSVAASAIVAESVIVAVSAIAVASAIAGVWAIVAASGTIEVGSGIAAALEIAAV
jgi:hypothetical protein